MNETTRGVESRVPRRRELSRLVGLAATGVICGVVAKIADESGVTWAGDMGTYLGVWVLALAVISLLAPTIAGAAQRSSAFFVPVCLGYYGWSGLVLGFGGGLPLFVWLVVAVTAVPVGAAAIWWATRHPGALPGAIMAAVAGLILSEGSLWRFWLYARGQFPELGLRPVQAVLEIVLAVGIVVLLPRHIATRLWAVAMMIPAAWLFRRLVDVTVYSFI